MARSATILWCPGCEDCRPCRVVTASEAENFDDYDFDGAYGNRFHVTDHEDLNFFLRYRQCSVCGFQFQTVEILREFLYELARLRNAVKELTLRSATCEDAAMETSQKLKTLMTFLHSLERKP
jgi:hypothetical protein